MVGRYRPVIIGGSAIGNFLAYRLTQEGHKPIVIEEHTEVGQPVQCTGIVSERILKFESLPKSVIRNRLNSASLH